jgi:Tol biopolymer transport system component/DNA-binding winged helix-turn-helix (wHTH) protein
MQNLSSDNQNTYEFESFRLDAVRRTLLREGQIVPLTSKRLEILLVLVRNKGRVVTKDELMQQVWPDTIVEENNLAHNISALRKALGETPGEHRFIITIPGQGYQFVASLSASETSSSDAMVIERTRSRLVIEEDDSDAQVSDQSRNNSNIKHARFITPMKSAMSNETKTRTPSLTATAAVTAVIALGVALGIYILTGLRSSRPEPFTKLKMTRLTTAGRAGSSVISPDGKYLAYVIEDSQGQSLWLRHVSTSSNVPLVPASQVQYWGISFSPSGDYVYYCTFDSSKSHDNLYRVPILGGPSTLLPIESNSPITFSPDGKQFAYLIPSSGGETHLKIANADGSEISTLAKSSQPEFFQTYPAGPAWSPDGKTIACSVVTSDNNGLNCRLVGIQVSDGKQIGITNGYWCYIGQTAWVKDGKNIVFTAAEKPATQNQVYVLSLESGETRRVTNDLADYRGISLTSDSSSLVTVERRITSSIRVAPSDDLSAAKEVAAEVGGLEQVCFTHEGKIVYRSSSSGESALWSLSSDGSERTQLAAFAPVELGFDVSPGGPYVVYTSAHAGTINLWRLDTRSGAAMQLTHGNGESRPQCSPDGQSVIYEQGIGNVRRTLWKVPIEGGDPAPLTDFHALRPAISPDGSNIAFFFMDNTRANSPWCVGIVSINGGEMMAKFDIPSTVISRFVNWTSDSKNLAYINDLGGVSNVWLQPINGNAPPSQITNFQTGRILAFDWSRDGKQLVFSQATESSYVALATGLSE